MKKRLSLFRIFGRYRAKSKLIDGKYEIQEAFKLGGVRYYHFPNQYNVPAGRHLAALAYYQELEMRCDAEYLRKFTAAMTKVLSDPKKINLMAIAKMVSFTEERLEMLPLPEYILRLASVLFFDKSESFYSYDFDYNRKKIERWKRHDDILAFFLQTPLVELIPSLKPAIESLRVFSPVVQKIDQTHQQFLSGILSEKA
jgi:hypothetical protein